MAEYLDQTGLTYFWGKIKSLVSGQIATSVKAAKRGQALRGYATNIAVSSGYTQVHPSLTEVKDTDSDFVIYSGGKITIQKKGVYSIDMCALWDTNATNKILWIGTSKNGSSVLNSESSTCLLIPSASYKPYVNYTGNIALDRGDTIVPTLMANIGGATCSELRINVTFNGQAGE